jgi:flagellar biosynthesis protein FlhG
MPPNIRTCVSYQETAEIPGLANIPARQKAQLAKRLLAIPDVDYLVLDLGAGTGTNILDFFLLSGRGLVVTAPTLTATLNGYLFLKNAVFRLMWDSFKPKSRARAILESLRKDGASLQRAYVPEILGRVAEADPDSRAEFDRRMARFSPRLIMNMLEDPKDAEKAQKIRRSCREYLGMDLEHLGVLYRDGLQDIAQGSRIPIIRYKPQSILSQGIYRIADKILSTEADDEEAYDSEYLDDSFSAADSEAELDFEAKAGYVEELLSSGAEPGRPGGDRAHAAVRDRATAQGKQLHQIKTGHGTCPGIQGIGSAMAGISVKGVCRAPCGRTWHRSHPQIHSLMIKVAQNGLQNHCRRSWPRHG